MSVRKIFEGQNKCGHAVATDHAKGSGKAHDGHPGLFFRATPVGIDINRIIDTNKGLHTKYKFKLV